MSKSKNYVFLISPFSFFNIEALPLFEGLDKEHSAQLYRNLLLNYLDIFSSPQMVYRVVYCFDERDDGYLPDQIAAQNDIIYYKKDSYANLIYQLTEKYLPNIQCSLFLTANSIAVSLNNIKNIFDVLLMEDNLVVLGESKSNQLTFVALNYNNAELLACLNYYEDDFETALKKVCKYNHSIHRSKGYLKINYLNDFKDMYKELSKKESWTYCSQHMHELFTHLFIEYKDLLK